MITQAQAPRSRRLAVDLGNMAAEIGCAATAMGWSTRTTTDRARSAAERACGVRPYPVGTGNQKVGGPSTYRGIEETCPRSCPLFASCYATEGNVNIHQMRAGQDVSRSLGAYAVGLALVIAGHAPAVRLHTSGDFGAAPAYEEPDSSYVSGLVELTRTARENSGTMIGSCAAWTYTHLPESPARDRMISDLAGVGITVLISDALVGGGAIVMPHDRARDLRRRLRARGETASVVLCPEQTAARKGRTVTCAQCRLCHDAPHKDRIIVFDPIGGEARKSHQDRWTPAAPLAHVLDADR